MPNIPNELLSSIYSQGALIYGGALEGLVSTATQTAIERAFEVYRREIETATATTRSTTTTTTGTGVGPVMNTAQAKAMILNWVNSNPGVTKSQVIEEMAPMPATRCGVLLRTLINSGEITSPGRDGPYYPQPRRTVTGANETTTQTTRQLQAGPVTTGDEI